MEAEAQYSSTGFDYILSYYFSTSQGDVIPRYNCISRNKQTVRVLLCTIVVSWWSTWTIGFILSIIGAVVHSLFAIYLSLVSIIVVYREFSFKCLLYLAFPNIIRSKSSSICMVALNIHSAGYCLGYFQAGPQYLLLKLIETANVR